jgi:hypothetical protein
MVQMDRVPLIRAKWEQAGRPPCSHVRLDKEYYLGAQTGDYVCLDCGEDFMRSEVDAMRKAKRNIT